MHSFVTKMAGAAAVLAGAASAQTFRILTERQPDGVGTPIIEERAWYGDGHLYIGEEVPSTIENSFDILVPEFKQESELLVAPEDDGELADGAMLVLNNGTDATGPLRIIDGEDEIGDDDIFRFLRWGTFMLPQRPGGNSPTEMHYFLEETDAEGTFRLTWRTPGTVDDGLTAVNMTLRL